MTLNSKALGLALLAAFAMSAVLVSGAAANTKHFHFETKSSTLLGEQIEVEEVEITAGKVTCNKAKYEGAAEEETVETLYVLAKYEECHDDLGRHVVVDMNGCYYVFHSAQQTPEKPPVTHPPVIDIECTDEGGTETGPIVVAPTVGGTIKCLYTFPEQTGLQGTSGKGVLFTNQGSGATRDVLMELHLEGLHYIEDPGTGLGACKEGTSTEGTFYSRATLKGFSKGKQTGFWYE